MGQKQTRPSGRSQVKCLSFFFNLFFIMTTSPPFPHSLSVRVAADFFYAVETPRNVEVELFIFFRKISVLFSSYLLPLRNYPSRKAVALLFTNIPPPLSPATRVEGSGSCSFFSFLLLLTF
jgi:hypothetical protein